MDSNDVGVIKGGHDLDLPPDVDKILLILNFVFPDRFDSNLQVRARRKKTLGLALKGLSKACCHFLFTWIGAPRLV